MQVVLAGFAVGGLAWAVDARPSDGAESAIGPIIVLGNLPGPWLIASFVAGVAHRRLPTGALAGVVAIAIGLAIYYGLSWVAVGGPAASNTLARGFAWSLLAVAAGPIFGIAGALSSRRHSRGSTAGLALMAGALLAEAVLLLVAASPYRPLGGFHATVVAMGEVVLALSVPMMLTRRRDYALVLATSLAVAIAAVTATLLAIAFVRDLTDRLTAISSSLWV